MTEERRNRLTELLQNFADGTYSSNGTICDGTKVDDVVDHLVVNSVTVQEWISVKDRLPEPRQIVLVSMCEPVEHFNYPYKEKIALLFRYEERKVTGNEIKWKRPFGGETIHYDEIVTHWMPLPELPEEDKQ